MFLCNPISFDDAEVGWTAVFLVLIFFFFVWNPTFFITLWIKKELKEKGMISEIERKFLMIYYGGISFLIIALGTFFKLRLL